MKIRIAMKYAHAYYIICFKSKTIKTNIHITKKSNFTIINRKT